VVFAVLMILESEGTIGGGDGGPVPAGQTGAGSARQTPDGPVVRDAQRRQCFHRWTTARVTLGHSAPKSNAVTDGPLGSSDGVTFRDGKGGSGAAHLRDGN